jgi:hypothetical protein
LHVPTAVPPSAFKELLPELQAAMVMKPRLARKTFPPIFMSVGT